MNVFGLERFVLLKYYMIAHMHNRGLMESVYDVFVCYACALYRVAAVTSSRQQESPREGELAVSQAAVEPPRAMLPEHMTHALQQHPTVRTSHTRTSSCPILVVVHAKTKLEYMYISFVVYQKSMETIVNLLQKKLRILYVALTIVDTR